MYFLNHALSAVISLKRIIAEQKGLHFKRNNKFQVGHNSSMLKKSSKIDSTLLDHTRSHDTAKCVHQINKKTRFNSRLFSA